MTTSTPRPTPLRLRRTCTSRPRSPVPPTPFPWLWRCHKCLLIYRFSAALNRCLTCSHRFCRRCVSEIDYDGWDRWTAYYSPPPSPPPPSSPSPLSSFYPAGSGGAETSPTLCSPERAGFWVGWRGGGRGGEKEKEGEGWREEELREAGADGDSYSEEEWDEPEQDKEMQELAVKEWCEWELELLSTAPKEPSFLSSHLSSHPHISPSKMEPRYISTAGTEGENERNEGEEKDEDEDRPMFSPQESDIIPSISSIPHKWRIADPDPAEMDMDMEPVFFTLEQAEEQERRESITGGEETEAGGEREGGKPSVGLDKGSRLRRLERVGRRRSSGVDAWPVDPCLLGPLPKEEDEEWRRDVEALRED